MSKTCNELEMYFTYCIYNANNNVLNKFSNRMIVWFRLEGDRYYKIDINKKISNFNLKTKSIFFILHFTHFIFINIMFVCLN